MKKIILIFILVIITGSILYAETKKVITGKLNINKASEEDFTLLPGIGKITAFRTVQFREKIGGFKAVVELKRVDGIGDNLFNEIKDYLTLTDESNLEVLIDINSATLNALDSLPGMSEKEAESIIEYRKRNEGFKRIEDLLLVGGIDKKEFEEIKGLVTVLPWQGKE